MISVGLIVALPGEKKTLTNARIQTGRFSRLNENTWLGVSGVGPENALRCAESLIGRGCRALLSWGCAAAIGPDPVPGDLFVPERVLAADGQIFTADREWRRRLLTRLSCGLRVRGGDLAESTGLVETSADKRKIYLETAAQSLDMESAAIARAAFRHNLPFVTIRAIADPAEMDLPKPVAAAMNRDGEVELPRLLGSILRHPAALPDLIRLGHYFRAAQGSLRLAARELANDFSPDIPRGQIPR